jgi:RimJ/RimL family protein N-acetyltransferase
MEIFLETERLVLRRFTEDDVDLVVRLDGDPEVMRYLSGGRPTSRDVIASEALPRFLNYYERVAGYGYRAAVERSIGEFLGWFHFRPREGGSPDEAELGYRLRMSAWGRGYASEGSRALIRKGFTALGVRRVVASTMAVILASRAAATCQAARRASIGASRAARRAGSTPKTTPMTAAMITPIAATAGRNTTTRPM